MIGAHIGPFSTSGGIAQAGLDFNFSASLYQKIDTDGTNMARTSTLSDLVTVSRASKKTNAGGWDFTSGSTVGALTEVDNNVAATDGTKGILVEESSTNEIRNPRCEGAVAGTPGTRPTNWSITTYGVSISIVGSGTEDGWPYVDIRFNGTPTSSPFVAFENNTQVSVANGEAWTASFGHRLVGGDTTNILGVKAVGFLYNSGPTYLSELYAAPTMPISSTHTRVSETATISEPTAASMLPAMTLLWDGSGDIDITLRIYAPQLEQKAYPTSPIFPPVSTPGAATRNADDAELAAGGWLADDGDPFTVFAKICSARPAPENARINVLALSDGSFSNIANLYLNSDPLITRVRTQSGGGADTTAVLAPLTVVDQPSGTISIAVAFETNNLTFSASGGTQQTDTSTALPVGITKMELGRDPVGRRLNGYITDCRYFPERLTDAQLEALVGN